MGHTEFYLKAFLEKGAKNPGKECSSVVRSFRVKRSASSWSLLFQFFGYLSMYFFLISNCVHAP